MKTCIPVLFLFCFFMSSSSIAVSPAVSAFQLPVFNEGQFIGTQNYQLADVVRIGDLNHQIRYWVGLFLGRGVMAAGLSALSKVSSGEGFASGHHLINGVAHTLWHASSGIGDKTVTFFFVVINDVAHMVALAQHLTAASYRIINELPGNSIVNIGQHDFVLP